MKWNLCSSSSSHSGWWLCRSSVKNGHPPLWKVSRIPFHPTFDGLLLTILLVMPILGSDELRLQGDDVLVPRSAQYGSQDHVGVGVPCSYS